MVLLKKLSIATAGATAIISVFSVPVFAFTLTQPNGRLIDFLLEDSSSTSSIGTVSLNSLAANYLAPPTAGSTLFTVFGAEAANQFPNWTVVSGPALGGTLAISKYDARASAGQPALGLKPRGGVDMIATYTKAATDPAIANLRFIQLFTDNATNNTLMSHIDPFPNHDSLPWYYTDALHTTNSTPTTMTFIDYPSDPVTSIPFDRTVSFETYLATFDNTTKVATIRDGWSWGYEVQAVPEPATLLGTAMALGCGAFFKKKVSTKGKR